MITTALLRTDFPEFKNTSFYPDSGIVFWLNMASRQINQNRWGTPQPFDAVAVSVAAGGTGYAVGEVVTAAGGRGISPTTVLVDTVDGSGVVLTAHAVNYGAYFLLPTSPVAQASSTLAGTDATFNLSYSYGLGTDYDLGMELYAAHHLVLEKRATDEAANGAPPGTMVGPVSSQGVDKVSVGYDVNAGIETDAGHWNLTVYGTRFMRLLKMFGAGPIQIGAGCGVFDPLSSQNAWLGPVEQFPGLPQ